MAHFPGEFNKMGKTNSKTRSSSNNNKTAAQQQQWHNSKNSKATTKKVAATKTKSSNSSFYNKTSNISSTNNSNSSNMSRILPKSRDGLTCSKGVLWCRPDSHPVTAYPILTSFTHPRQGRSVVQASRQLVVVVQHVHQENLNTLFSLYQT